MPYVAKQVSSVDPDSLSCTSSITPNCNTITCVVRSEGQRLEFTFLPCHRPPGVRVSVLARNGTMLLPSQNLTQPMNLLPTLNLGSEVTLNISLNHHQSNLTLGMEVGVACCYGYDVDTR